MASPCFKEKSLFKPYNRFQNLLLVFCGGTIIFILNILAYFYHSIFVSIRFYYLKIFITSLDLKKFFIFVTFLYFFFHNFYFNILAYFYHSIFVSIRFYYLKIFITSLDLKKFFIFVTFLYFFFHNFYFVSSYFFLKYNTFFIIAIPLVSIF